MRIWFRATWHCSTAPAYVRILWAHSKLMLSSIYYNYKQKDQKTILYTVQILQGYTCRFNKTTKFTVKSKVALHLKQHLQLKNGIIRQHAHLQCTTRNINRFWLDTKCIPTITYQIQCPNNLEIVYTNNVNKSKSATNNQS